jgi:hypothetical protein
LTQRSIATEYQSLSCFDRRGGATSYKSLWVVLHGPTFFLAFALSGAGLVLVVMADFVLPDARRGAYFLTWLLRLGPLRLGFSVFDLRLRRAQMRVLAAGMVIALLTIPTLPAYAQTHGGPEKELTGPEELAQKRREEAADVEKAYKSTLKATGSNNATTKLDPWGNIRAAEPSQSKGAK